MPHCVRPSLSSSPENNKQTPCCAGFFCLFAILLKTSFQRLAQSKNPLAGVFVCCFNVELAGVEPASKHGSHTLSTCLVLLDFRDTSAAEQPNMPLVSVVSPSDRDSHQASPGLRAPPCRVGSGPDRPGSVPSRLMRRDEA